MECIIFVLFIILTILLLYDIVRDQEFGGLLFRIISYIILIAIFVLCLIYWTKPTAIDVYRNKTTLEITYKDGVPIDSTVVWKNK